MKRWSVFLLLMGLVFSPASYLRLFSGKDGLATAAPLENSTVKKGTSLIQRDFAAQKNEGLRTMPESKTTTLKKQGSYAHVRTGDSIITVVNHPAFKGFGRYILPRCNDLLGKDTPLTEIHSLLPYHSHVNPGITVSAINHMIDEVNDGKTIFYHFYTEQQKRADPSKESSGLFSSGEIQGPRLPLCARGEAFPTLVLSMRDFPTLWS